MAVLRVRDDAGNIIDIPAIKGDTPVKGVDYFTEADKEELVANLSDNPNFEYMNGTITPSSSEMWEGSACVVYMEEFTGPSHVSRYYVLEFKATTATTLDMLLFNVDEIKNLYLDSDLENAPLQVCVRNGSGYYINAFGGVGSMRDGKWIAIYFPEEITAGNELKITVEFTTFHKK